MVRHRRGHRAPPVFQRHAPGTDSHTFFCLKLNSVLKILILGVGLPPPVPDPGDLLRAGLLGGGYARLQRLGRPHAAHRGALRANRREGNGGLLTGTHFLKKVRSNNSRGKFEFRSRETKRRTGTGWTPGRWRWWAPWPSSAGSPDSPSRSRSSWWR